MYAFPFMSLIIVLCSLVIFKSGLYHRYHRLLLLSYAIYRESLQMTHYKRLEWTNQRDMLLDSWTEALRN